MVYSPLNLVPKPSSKFGYRLVHDLSYPWDGQQSVNSCIPEENSSVKYHYIDEVIEMGIALGPGNWGARIDIDSAFRNLGLHFSVVPVFGIFLNGMIYVNSSLPFGLASSCLIFEKVSCCLQWVVSNETGCFWISHFLDDFPLLEKTCETLLEFMNKFYKIMKEIGMPVFRFKNIRPNSNT